MRKKIVAGNWKMNLCLNDAKQLCNELLLSSNEFPKDVQVIICVPHPFILTSKNIVGDAIRVGGQNCHYEQSGAFTGEVSAEMLLSVGADCCLVGHSERRSMFGDVNSTIAKKIGALLNNEITPIFCCGELLEEREKNNQEDVVATQLNEGLFFVDADEIKNVIIAYEPVWAIGTGKTASPEQAQQMHSFIRDCISQKYGNLIAQQTSILYGGSCKPSNAKELFSQLDIDGGLIGGAALKSESFIQIIQAEI